MSLEGLVWLMVWITCAAGPGCWQERIEQAFVDRASVSRHSPGIRPSRVSSGPASARRLNDPHRLAELLRR